MKSGMERSLMEHLESLICFAFDIAVCEKKSFVLVLCLGLGKMLSVSLGAEIIGREEY